MCLPFIIVADLGGDLWTEWQILTRWSYSIRKGRQEPKITVKKVEWKMKHIFFYADDLKMDWCNQLCSSVCTAGSLFHIRNCKSVHCMQVIFTKFFYIYFAFRHQEHLLFSTICIGLSVTKSAESEICWVHFLAHFLADKNSICYVVLKPFKWTPRYYFRLKLYYAI